MTTKSKFSKKSVSKLDSILSYPEKPAMELTKLQKLTSLVSYAMREPVPPAEHRVATSQLSIEPAIGGPLDKFLISIYEEISALEKTFGGGEGIPLSSIIIDAEAGYNNIEWSIQGIRAESKDEVNQRLNADLKKKDQARKRKADLKKQHEAGERELWEKLNKKYGSKEKK